MPNVRSPDPDRSWRICHAIPTEWLSRTVACWLPMRTKSPSSGKITGTMTLDTPEFIRRFLMHVLPSGFHRIRHYGMLANSTRADSLALARILLLVPEPVPLTEEKGETPPPVFVCRSCGEPMIIIEVFERANG